MRLRGIATVALGGAALALVSCGGYVPADVSRAVEDAAEVQALLPALEASHALVEPSDGVTTSVRTIIPGTPGSGVEDLPGTPAALWATRASGATVVRFPATGYLGDFYGEQGTRAFLELRESSDLTGGYQVSLYVYPALSAAVWYILEQYRVTADNWYDIVDAAAATDPTAYEALETYYFDGRVESRTLIWSRYTTDTPRVYERWELAEVSLDYPDAIPEPTMIAPAAGGDFSSKTTSDIPAKGGSPHTTATELYNQIAIDGGYLKQSVSYVTDTYRYGTVYTVRAYEANTVDGSKKVRAKSSGSFSRGNKEWTTGSEETIDVTMTGGVTSYQSTVTTTKDGVAQSTVVTTVSESAAGSNSFTGTATVTQGTSETVRTVTMDATSGVDLTNGAPLSAMARALAYGVDVSSLESPDGTEQPRTVTVSDLGNGGSFSGEYVGGVIDGEYSSSDGTTYPMVVGRLFTEVDEAAY